MHIFELDILGSSKYKNGQTITIYDCLEYYTLNRKNNLYCYSCKKYTQITNSSKIYCSPNIFAFSLDRKNLDNNYLNIKFYVQEKIDLKNYIEIDKAPRYYQLIGIVSFSSQEKKYVSFCISPINKQWYYYNDEIINMFEKNYILQSNNNYKYIPCILLYEAINDNTQ